MSSSSLFYWMEQTIILLAHLILLGWIIFILRNGGSYTVSELLVHFTGIGLYGASLIRICAYLGKRRFSLEQAKNQANQS